MLRQLISALFVLVLAISFSTLTFGQEKMQKEAKKEEKKMEMSKEEKTMGPLKSISCDATCGFMCRSHDEKELMSVVRKHAKMMHKMDMKDKQMMEMMKTEEGAEMKKEEKK